MEAAMRQPGFLYALESKRPLKEFDIIGFSLGCELCYTNVLNMLDLSQIPVLTADRSDAHPLIIAGGSTTLNPEPMADFIDLFVLGDGEEVLVELVDAFRTWKSSGKTKADFLREAAKIEGIYVPGLYRVEYGPDGLLKSFAPTVPEAKPVIKRRMVNKLLRRQSSLLYPSSRSYRIGRHSRSSWAAVAASASVRPAVFSVRCASVHRMKSFDLLVKSWRTAVTMSSPWSL
jgi:radical SAM superfamily enzyme YgiQ (UPF0313 family)